MKVMHVGQMIGGLDVYIRNAITYTSGDYEYVIVSGAGDKHLPVVKNGNTVREYSISMYRKLNPLKDILAIIQAVRIVIKERPDVIHCHSAKGGFIGRWVGALTGVRTLYTPHAFSFLSADSRWKRKAYLWFEKIAKLNSVLLACSESERELAVRQVGYRKDRTLVWHNAVPDIAKMSDGTVNDRYVCYIGRPSYQKNTFFLLDVAKEVIKRHPEIKFYLVGAGYYSPDLEEVERRIAEYGLKDSFVMLSWVSHDKTLEYINGSLFYLTCARYEGLPLAVIEAMSQGKPVIASDVVGNRDCVKNGYNGFLLPLVVDDFVEHICYLIENMELRQKMSRNSRRFFESEFRIEKRIGLLESIYIAEMGGGSL